MKVEKGVIPFTKYNERRTQLLDAYIESDDDDDACSTSSISKLDDECIQCSYDADDMSLGSLETAIDEEDGDLVGSSVHRDMESDDDSHVGTFYNSLMRTLSVYYKISTITFLLCYC